MKIKWIAGAVLACSLTAPAFAQIGVSVYMRHTPPPVRVEVRPEMPGPGYTWIDGYWGTQNGRYVWVGGRWNQPPYEGAYYNHAHYDHTARGWEYHEGRWDGQPGHDDHHDNGHDDHHDDHH